MLTKVEIDNPEALSKYYRLLLSIARVITSVVLSRGPQNEQTIEGAKGFLVENRPLVVSMFKRQARIGGVSFNDAGVDIEELVELFVLLIAVTDFLDVSQNTRDPFALLADRFV
jgi:nuclear pore complex protein Nup205